MKKITLLLTMSVILCWQTNAQFTEDFEGGVPGQFTETTDANNISWESCGGSLGGQTCPITGSTSATFYRASYSTTQTSLTTPTLDLSAGNYRLTYLHSQEAWASDQNTLLVEISTNGGTDWTTIVNHTSSISTAIPEQHILDAYTTTASTIIRFTGTSVYGRSIILDDVVVGPVPSCAEVSGMMTSNITASSMDLSWTASASGETAWEYVVQAAGTGTPAGSGTASAMNSTSVSSLSAETAYEAYVRADCGGGSFGAWVGPLSFTTLCNALSVPFTETFNSDSTTENCWIVLDENGDSVEWNLNYTNNAFEGDQVAAIYTDYNGGDNDDWLISPTITLTGNERLKFQYRVQSSGEPNDFELLLSTSGVSPSDFSTTLIANTSYDNTLYQELEVNLSAYTGDVNIAWHVPDLGLDGWRLYIDSVVVDAIPSCAEVSDIMTSNITASSVDLSWTASASGETAWEYVVQAAGTGTPAGSGIASAMNSASVSSLSAETAYEVYVRADCGGSFGAWVGPVNFTTSCVAVVPAYTADFSNNPVDNCWVEAGAGEVSSGPSSTGASDWITGSYAVGNSNRINIFSNTDREWLISPAFDLSAGGPYGLKVNVAVTDWNSSTASDSMGSDDEVQLLMSTDNGATWTSLTTWNSANEPPAGGVDYIEDLTAQTGTVIFAIFASDGTVNDVEDYDFHIGTFEISGNVLSTDTFDNPAAFTYYPNPVKNTLTLNAQNNIENVSMYNMLGQEVLRAAPNAMDSTLDMSNLETGTYFVKVTIQDITQTIRVIKQ